jgi:3-oxoacyl-[acyl-carrier-protein] synthase-3
MKSRITGLRLRAVAAAVPENVFSLRELAGPFGERDVERIIHATGIRSVCVAPPGVCTSDLCEAAALRLLRELDVPPSSIDAVVFVSQTADYVMPATSVLLQERLGLPQRVLAFDLNYGCSGYVYGLLQAAMLIASGGCQRVLLCAGDVITPFVNASDRANRMVFGDGGSASLIERGDDTFVFDTFTDGSGSGSLIVPAGGARQPRSAETGLEHLCPDGYARSAENLHMNGKNVFNFVMNVVPDFILELLRQADWSKSELESLVLHQANQYIVGNVRRVLELPEAVAGFNCGDVGNTGPASIPLSLALDHRRFATRPPVTRALFCGYGVGYSVAGVCLPLQQLRVLEPVILASVPGRASIAARSEE